MRRSVLVGRIRLALLLGGLASSSCGDVVVGQFSGTAAGTVTPDGSASETSAAPPSTDESSATADVDPEPFDGCYSDDFDGQAVDGALWNAWTEEDSQVEVMAGALRFTPPSFGLYDAGLVGHIDYAFRFDDGWVRMKIGTSPNPDRPVSLFLLIQQGPDDSLSISVGRGSVHVRGVVDDETAFADEFPKDAYPAWLGIRNDGERVHFEISDDGESWVTLASYEQPTIYDDAAAIIMAQTYGDDVGQETVSVERFEACI